MYRIMYSSHAAKSLDLLERQLKQRILSAVDRLAFNPRPHGCKKLKDMNNHYRIRIGDYRVIYRVQDDQLVILIIEIANRDEAYLKR